MFIFLQFYAKKVTQASSSSKELENSSQITSYLVGVQTVFWFQLCSMTLQLTFTAWLHLQSFAKASLDLTRHLLLLYLFYICCQFIFFGFQLLKLYL